MERTCRTGAFFKFDKEKARLAKANPKYHQQPIQDIELRDLADNTIEGLVKDGIIEEIEYENAESIAPARVVFKKQLDDSYKCRITANYYNINDAMDHAPDCQMESVWHALKDKFKARCKLDF